MITLVKAIAGSRLYGLDTPTSDHDFMGIGIMEQREKLGLRHTNQAGFNDDVTYEITKWIQLALNGNPTILQMLWIQPEHVVECHPDWWKWQTQLRELVLTERCRAAFLGYLDGQRKKLLNNRGQREELKQRYGYDVKFAAHMIRLGIQGIDVVRTGNMWLPMRQVHRTYLRATLEGAHTQESVLSYAAKLEQNLKEVPSVLPLGHDPDAVDAWMQERYLEMWRLV